jgi:drug/metabolite transporter (DMT)-like permease
MLADTAGLPRAVRRRLRTDPVLRRWVAAWIGASLLGIANGALRELVYKESVGEAAAGQISTGSLIALLALYFWILERRWPIPTTRAALTIGAAWVVLTIVFEFGFGHYVDGDSWSELAENYNVAAGNLWILVLISIALGPAAVRALRRRKQWQA